MTTMRLEEATAKPRADGRVASVQPLLLTRTEAARVAGMSPSRFDRLRAEGLAPPPSIDEGDGQRRGKARFVRWSLAVMQAWVEQGLPAMSRFKSPRRGAGGTG